MSSHQGPEYAGRSRFPKQQPEGICRGCLGPITDPRRQTWCSQPCVKKYHPFHVKEAVNERDQGKCQMCGRDCSRRAVALYHKNTPKPHSPDYRNDCKLEYPYDPKAYYSHPLYKKYVSDFKEWKRNIPKPEYDHIVPHSEGGQFVLENVRLLCRACHRKRTKEWHAERALAKKGMKPLI